MLMQVIALFSSYARSHLCTWSNYVWPELEHNIILRYCRYRQSTNRSRLGTFSGADKSGRSHNPQEPGTPSIIHNLCPRSWTIRLEYAVLTRKVTEGSRFKLVTGFVILIWKVYDLGRPVCSSLCVQPMLVIPHWFGYYCVCTFGFRMNPLLGLASRYI